MYGSLAATPHSRVSVLFLWPRSRPPAVFHVYTLLVFLLQVPQISVGRSTTQIISNRVFLVLCVIAMGKRPPAYKAPQHGVPEGCAHSPLLSMRQAEERGAAPALQWRKGSFPPPCKAAGRGTLSEAWLAKAPWALSLQLSLVGPPLLTGPS